MKYVLLENKNILFFFVITEGKKLLKTKTIFSYFKVWLTIGFYHATKLYFHGSTERNSIGLTNHVHVYLYNSNFLKKSDTIFISGERGHFENHFRQIFFFQETSKGCLIPFLWNQKADWCWFFFFYAAVKNPSNYVFWKCSEIIFPRSIYCFCNSSNGIGQK